MFENKEFDVVLLDCAPTGESLRFISIPTTLEWYIKKIFKMERAIVRVARPVAKHLYDIPLPGEDYFKGIEKLFKRLRGVDEILVDSKTTSVRLVTNPEKIVLKETQRAFMYFSLYRMSVDAIIMNRIIPDSMTEPYFEGWRKSQKEYIKEAENYFSPVPIFLVPLFRGEVLGQCSLGDLANQIYGERNPLDRFFDGEPYSFKKSKGKYRLKLKLPFIEKQDVDLNKISDELIVRVGSFKRNILLPRQVAASKVVSAKLDGQYLRIYFEV